MSVNVRIAPAPPRGALTEEECLIPLHCTVLYAKHQPNTGGGRLTEEEGLVSLRVVVHDRHRGGVVDQAAPFVVEEPCTLSPLAVRFTLQTDDVPHSRETVRHAVGSAAVLHHPPGATLPVAPTGPP